MAVSGIFSGVSEVSSRKIVGNFQNRDLLYILVFRAQGKANLPETVTAFSSFSDDLPLFDKEIDAAVHHGTAFSGGRG